jgi:HAE1 family hydrophobic/amphiphilic exporter-1
MIDYFARHPTAANLLALVFLVFGIFSLPYIKRETFPEFTPNEISVTIRYPGATAEDVESTICQRVEDALESIANIEEIRAEALDNVANIVVEMADEGEFISFF